MSFANCGPAILLASSFLLGISAANKSQQKPCRQTILLYNKKLINSLSAKRLRTLDISLASSGSTSLRFVTRPSSLFISRLEQSFSASSDSDFASPPSFHHATMRGRHEILSVTSVVKNVHLFNLPLLDRLDDSIGQINLPVEW
jgi:hypothetical protein